MSGKPLGYYTASFPFLEEAFGSHLHFLTPAEKFALLQICAMAAAEINASGELSESDIQACCGWVCIREELEQRLYRFTEVDLSHLLGLCQFLSHDLQSSTQKPNPELLASLPFEI